jgi:triacylglycerol esterase/lipase EstA (alpha/beta hydrolase family)
VITIAAPHRGTPLADIALQDVQGPAQDAMNALLDLLGATISGTSDEDAHAAMTDLSAAGAADFARRHPDSPKVQYYSIAGRSGLTVADGDCAPDEDAPFVSRWTGSDPLDPILDASAVILDNALAGADAHDGLVPVASSRWGTFLGCVPADHMDEICQIAGDNPGTDFDCVGFYRDLVAWLATLE